jgi:hypothetical protein
MFASAQRGTDRRMASIDAQLGLVLAVPSTSGRAIG